MLNSPVLEVAIGLILIYLVLGLLCTSMNEFVAQLLGLRAENLAELIHGLFDGADRHRIAEDILSHPLVKGLSRKQVGVNAASDAEGVFGEITKLPSDLPPDLFASVVVDLLSRSREAKSEFAYDQRVLDLLGSLGVPSSADASTDTTRLKAWYSEGLERAKGWYKKRTQVLSFLVTLGLAAMLNADTIVISDRLASSPIERAKITAYANSLKEAPAVQDSPATAPATTSADEDHGITLNTESLRRLQTASLNFIGWVSGPAGDPRGLPGSAAAWMLKFVGLCITAFAASLGAPFWFDLLSKFMMVRSGGGTSSAPR